MSVLHARLALLIVGIATWFYGVRTDRDEVRWLGMAFLIVAILLRFMRRPGARQREDSPQDS